MISATLPLTLFFSTSITTFYFDKLSKKKKMSLDLFFHKLALFIHVSYFACVI